MFCNTNFLKNVYQRLPKTLITFAEILHTFPTYQCLQKGVWDFFHFFQNLRYLPKSKKDLVSTNPHKPSLSITQDLDKIKKIPEHPFVDIDKTETCTKFQQKILNYMAVGARESFQFFRQITSFLQNKRALSKLSTGFCIT